ncbi:sugar transferase [Flavobacterium sp.]|uniref:sugar transferase n=1 Tax=Flavobacterium sp. TaxID=239 RepID=UPI00121D07CA|nr:sugar transferase [Flavobacterium sp.]RZJ70847.1 MAG: sugar transferase [Flavobacterium sp.]
MFAKRLFDIFVSIAVLFFFGWTIVLFWILAAIDTRSNGLFLQKRVGRFAKFYTIFKLRSMRWENAKPIVSSFGKFIRRYKIDELPQFLNVLIGDMSLVGPRPDIAGYYDKLEGDDRKILELRPGLTSLAAIKYANEDAILESQPNPLRYNDEVLFPDKVKMNLDYYYNRSFFGDIRLLVRTFFKFASNTTT